MDLEAAAQAISDRLTGFFEEKTRSIGDLTAPGRLMVNAVQDLTMRGGKRLRGLMLFFGARAIDESAPDEGLLQAAAAFELLQSYLLIQDDWMDDDLVRRGGPTVHVRMADTFADPHQAASVAILASDLGCAWAHELLSTADFPAERRANALAAFSACHEEVVLGQFLDVTDQDTVQTVHLLKTAGYTVRQPIRIGAIVAGATNAQKQGLDGFAKPVGLAFQLRDDLLGTFGDPKKTGKAASNDLRNKKRTALLDQAPAVLPADQNASLQALLKETPTDARIGRMKELLEPVAEAIRTQIDQLHQEAVASLENADLTDSGRQALRTLAEQSAFRQH